MKNIILVKRVTNRREIEIVSELAREIWTQHYEPIIGKEQVDFMLNKFQSFKAISKNIKDGYIYYIAYNNSVPSGYSAIKMDNGIFLSKFYTKKAFRGMGLGKAMLNTILSHGNEKQESRIWLTCNKYNSNSLAAYEKMGFEIIDDIVTDIGNGYVMDDYVLEKRIKESKT